MSNTKGKLKIYIGMSAGVGKTYRMLQEAHTLMNDGINIYIGYIETHNRKETEALVDGLPFIPRRSVFYKGKQLVKAGLCQVGGIGIALKQGWRGHIHPFVGALGRENHRYQQLVGIVVQQLCFGLRRVLLKIIDYKAVAFFPCHGANWPRI